jgi:Rieske Fe-S protein
MDTDFVRAPALDADQTTDVVVMGAGIAGLSVAYELLVRTLHVLSAACTHAGCVVRWNSLEQCWDCPCHGSQFAADGSVLNGPAVSPLQRLDDASERREAAE